MSTVTLAMTTHRVCCIGIFAAGIVGVISANFIFKESIRDMQRSISLLHIALTVASG